MQSYQILSDEGKIVDTKSVTFLDFPKPVTTNVDDEDFEIIVENSWERPAEPINLTQASKEPVTPLGDGNSGEDIIIKQEEEDKIFVDCDDNNDIGDNSDNSGAAVAETLIPSPSRVLRNRTVKVKPVKYTCLTGDPASFKQAMQSPNKEDRRRAADKELANIEGHEVWEEIYDIPDSFL